MLIIQAWRNGQIWWKRKMEDKGGDTFSDGIKDLIYI